MKRGKDTEKKILQAALKLFIQKGYHGTSLKDITGKIGMAKSAPYSHFKSKGELVFRLIGEYEKHFVDEVAKIKEEHQGNAIKKLHHVIRFNNKIGVKHADLLIFFIYISNELRGNPEFEPSLERVERRLEVLFGDLFQLGIRQGLFKKELDSDILSKLFLACSRGIFRKWALRRDSSEGIELTKTWVTLLFKGIKA